VDDLTLKVRDVDDVEVDQANRAHSGGRKVERSRPQQCCKIVPDSRLCHFQNAAQTEVRARMAAPARSSSKAG
jgi:hypothetical protein